MKKFLSLVLALVMTMSLVTISAGAKDFTDGEKVNYDEAVAVLSAVKVADGYPDGSFKPQTQLNRGQAAKIICNLILGPTTASELPASVAPFKDVPANSTFAGYIAYCAKEGIVGGYADGTFKPGNSLTGYAFMKMLLGALGYDKDIEGYNGANWSINVAKQALGLGLDAGLKEDFDGQKIVTREEACLFALNTLKATMVEYEAKTSVNVGGAEVTIAGSKAKEVAQGTYKSFTNDAEDKTLQFCERYFKDLKLEETYDDFGRPSNTWKVKNTEIGTFANKADLVATFTEKVSKSTMYETVGKSVYDALTEKWDNSYMLVWFDGELQDVLGGYEDKAEIDAYIEKNNSGKSNGTANGDVTEVYVDSDSNVTIVTVRTYLFQVVNDYDSKKETVTLTTDSNKYDTAITLTDRTLRAEDFPVIEDLKADDYVLVTAEKQANGKYTVKSIEKAETVTEDITGYKYDGDVTTAKLFAISAGKYVKYNTGDGLKWTDGTLTNLYYKSHDGVVNTSVNARVKINGTYYYANAGTQIQNLPDYTKGAGTGLVKTGAGYVAYTSTIADGDVYTDGYITVTDSTSGWNALTNIDDASPAVTGYAKANSSVKLTLTNTKPIRVTDSDSDVVLSVGTPTCF